MQRSSKRHIDGKISSSTKTSRCNCTKSSIDINIELASSTIGDWATVSGTISGYRRYSTGPRERVRACVRRSLPTKSESISIKSICRASCRNTSAKRKRIWLKYSMKPKMHKQCCFSTNAIRSLGSEQMSRIPTINMQTSKSTTCSNALNDSRALPS